MDYSSLVLNAQCLITSSVGTLFELAASPPGNFFFGGILT